MKIRKRKQFATLVFFMMSSVVFYLACDKSTTSEDNGAIPAILTNVRVTNMPGGVEVSYDQPGDQNIMLVTAEYATEEGGKEIKRFDIETNNRGFTLTGLSTGVGLLTLYTVSHSGIRSEGVEVEIAPMLSPTLQYLQDVLASIEFFSIPSGIAYIFENPESRDLKFIMEGREDGQWIEYATETSTDDDGLYPYYNFTNAEVRITVSYNDDSESANPKTFAVNALTEEELDKSNWSKEELETDNWRGNYAGVAYAMESLWDKLLGTVTSPRFENKSEPLPHSFTIDLGEDQSLALSKIRIYHFANNLGNTYGQYNPKTIEIYGSNEPDADWANWTKITTCISQMPSGGSSPTNADLNHLRAGEEYRFPLFTSAYRYIRFKVLNTWTKSEGDATFIRLSEVNLYGVEQ